MREEIGQEPASVSVSERRLGEIANVLFAILEELKEINVRERRRDEERRAQESA